jgi:hypothetical protein
MSKSVIVHRIVIRSADEYRAWLPEVRAAIANGERVRVEGPAIVVRQSIHIPTRRSAA